MSQYPDQPERSAQTQKEVWVRKKLLQIPALFNDSPPVLSRLDKQLLAEATYNQFLGLLWSHGFFSDIRHLNDSRCWKPVVWLDSTGSLGA